MKELYKRHRPKELADVCGQKPAVRALEKFFETNRVPHTILITGPSGTGKTTLARIIARKLKCKGADLVELNSADDRGIDVVRTIRRRMHAAPMVSKCRMWLIDEAHGLTGEAQTALLKLLEDTPEHVYFILLTTHPAKIIPTIRTRSTHLQLELLPPGEMTTLISAVCETEKIPLRPDVQAKLIESAGGSPRQALVSLDMIRDNAPDEQLRMLSDPSTEAFAYKLVQALCRQGARWGDVKGMLDKIEDDPETIRWSVLGYASTMAVRGEGATAARAVNIIQSFRDNFYDSKRAGLIAACWEVCNAR